MGLRRNLRLAAGAALAAGVVAIPVTSASAAGNDAIHPGVMTHTNGAQCTANFIFRNSGGTYIGQAAHCSGTGGSTETNGCTAKSLPLGTKVQVGGSRYPGTMVYNSWVTMQRIQEKDVNACAYNDLALVKLDPRDVKNVDPSIPFWGGPKGVATTTPAVGSQVFSYGNSELRGGVSQFSPKRGIVVQNAGGGWSHTVYTLSPGIPGDSGSAFLDAQGRALGILSTVALAPLPASNGVGDLNKELTYARSHGFAGLSVVSGGAFSPKLG
jgi:hypothetical protein